MKADLVGAADIREALSKSASIVIQNLEATLANNYISLLQGHFFVCVSSYTVTITRAKHHFFTCKWYCQRDQDATRSLKLF